MKNIAGNNVSIFLYRFDLLGNGIDFVLNEAIAEDMYPDIAEKMKPLVHACCETLLRYRHLSVSNIIMDGNILVTGEFEVMLSQGLGRHFPDIEKQQLFQDAKKVADLLTEVMDRRSNDFDEGKQWTPSPAEHTKNHEKVKKGLEQLGRKKRQRAQLQWLADGLLVRPGLRQLRPEDLPSGVTTSSGYDHRGICYVFEHQKLGELGRIVMIKAGEQEMLMQADLYIGQENPESAIAKKRRAIFEEVVATIHACFNL
ncbi:hypothetical protein [Hydrotalea sp. AMD]|uniref:hypothetical protein n=1 Tax=Hydrotalea sp. AMD TaxID=2501297 RepID=UPI00257999D2|nr:hypothetical protein [Hydrotalea sp. AMD]